MTSYSADAVADTIETDPSLVEVLNEAFSLARERLNKFANDPDFKEKMILTFGETDRLLESWPGFQSEWQSDRFDFSTLFHVRPTRELNGAFGAFDAETNTSYLSSDFLSQNDAKKIAQVLLEQYGHSLSNQLNDRETGGDKGELFLAFVTGQKLSPEQIEAINSERDEITITIDGADVSVEASNRELVIVDEDLIGAVTEQTLPSGNLTDSGTITFSDADITDVHLVSENGTAIGSVLGALTAIKNTDTTGTGTDGALTWNYSVSAAAVEYLAAGQTKVESFYITLDDQNGGVITKQIDITITGTNDAPKVAALIPDKTATENSLFTFTIPAGSFTDIDAGDTITYTTATLDNGNPLPTWLTFNATTGTFSGKPLAANVTTLSVKVTARDNSNATVSDTFDLVINPLNLTGNLNAANNLSGTASNNIVTGGNLNDILGGGAGNDILNGGDGNDRLNGGNDNDTLYGGNSNDLLYGDAGDDVLYGDAGNDNLNGGMGQTCSLVLLAMTSSMAMLIMTSSTVALATTDSTVVLAMTPSTAVLAMTASTVVRVMTPSSSMLIPPKARI